MSYTSLSYHEKDGTLHIVNKKRELVLSGGYRPECRMNGRLLPIGADPLAINMALCTMSLTRRPAELVDRRGGLYIQADGQLIAPFALYDIEVEVFDVHQFQQQIPHEIMKRVCLFPNEKWPLYNLLARVPGAMDLFDNNPILAYLLCNYRPLHRLMLEPRSRTVESVVQMKQRDILKWIGFPSSKSVLNILRKTHPTSLTADEIRRFKFLLNDEPSRKLLAHVSTINHNVLAYIAAPGFRGYLTYALLEELAAKKGTSIDHTTTEEELWLHHMLNLKDKTNKVKIPRKIKSVRQMKEIADELEHEVYHSYSHEEGLPDAPFKGTESILPLDTYDALLEEAEEQANCVETYARYIQSGWYYIYRVAAPVRATLGICKNNNKIWKVDQIFGPKNSSIPEDIKEHLTEELLESGKG